MKKFHAVIDKTGLAHIADENSQYYESTIRTTRKPFIYPETGAKMGEEIRTTYKICTNDCISKQRIISFLEDKIKDITDYAVSFGLFIDKDISREIDIKKQIYQEVLDFVEKGGKDD